MHNKAWRHLIADLITAPAYGEAHQTLSADFNGWLKVCW